MAVGLDRIDKITKRGDITVLVIDPHLRSVYDLYKESIRPVFSVVVYINKSNTHVFKGCVSDIIFGDVREKMYLSTLLDDLGIEY